jgi:hypothetical protein
MKECRLPTDILGGFAQASPRRDGHATSPVGAPSRFANRVAPGFLRRAYWYGLNVYVLLTASGMWK